MDLQVDTPQGLTVGIDVKNWGRPVDASETQKSKDLLNRHPTLQVGIILSLKSSIEIYDTVHSESLGQHRVLWYYPQAQENRLETLIPLLLLCDWMAPFLKTQVLDDGRANLAALTQRLMGLLTLAQNIKDMDLHTASLQTTLHKVQRKVTEQKHLLSQWLTACEECVHNLSVGTTSSPKPAPPLTSPVMPSFADHVPTELSVSTGLPLSVPIMPRVLLRPLLKKRKPVALRT